MEFRVLGPLEVVDSTGRTLPLGGAKQRSVLAMLVLAANHVVSTERLIDGVWGEDAHERAQATLQVYVSNLRKLVEPPRSSGGGHQVIVGQRPGYILRAAPEAVDLLRFEHLVVQGRAAVAAGRAGEGARLLGAALDLWRGPALADLRGEPFAAAEVVRLDEARAAALEDRIEAELTAGEHARVVPELERLVAEHPLRERLWGQLMIALYRSGRQADALRAYGRARHTLAEELGIDPGPALRELERAVLLQDPSLGAPAVPGAAPGVRAAVKVPRPATPLVGRRQELETVLADLRDADVRLVTLTGPGGTGKTRLSVEAATAAADDFPGGVTFVPLATVSDAALVPAAVERALELPESAAEERLARLAQALQGPPALLVLDNMEQVLDAAPFVAALGDAVAELTVLVTSRAPLRVSGEREHAVPPLALPDLERLPARPTEAVSALSDVESVALFALRAAAARSGFRITPANARAVAEICVRLDGLPLAIELAAARTRLMDPATILGRLDRSLTLLTGGARDLPDRQRTLRATIDWSYGLLAPAERALLTRLGVFAGGFTLDAAETICGPGLEAEVVDSLAVLVDNSLVQLAQPSVDLRLRLLGGVQEYAAERLAAAGEESALLHERHAEHYVVLVEAVRPGLDGPEAPVLLQRLEAEYPNLRAALHWLLSAGRVDDAARLAAALRPFFLAQGRLTEGRALLADVLAAQPTGASRAAVKIAAGALAYYQTDWATARDLLCGGLDEAETLQDRALAAAARCLLGAIVVVDGDPDGGRAHAEAALEVARADSLYETHVLALSVLAIAAALTGDFAREKDLYAERLALVRSRGDRTRIADTLNTLAEIALDESAPDQARVWAEESLALARSTTKLETRDALITLARVALAERDTERAEETLHEAMLLSVELGQSFGLAQVMRALAAVTALRGDARRAATLFGAADRLHPSPAPADAPLEQDIRGQLEHIRSTLSPAEFGAAWSAGAALSRDDAVAYALTAAADPAQA